MRRAAAVVCVVLLGAGLLSCSSARQSERPLTSSEAERLAVTRFRNFDAGVRHIRLSVPAQGEELTVEGAYDFGTSTGYAAVTGADDDSLGVVWWNVDTIATRESPVESLPVPRPADGWTVGTLDPTASTFAVALTAVTALGADRPDNPQLVLQSDARWVGAETIDDDEVDEFVGPSSDDVTASSAPLADRARYWVDAEGELERFTLPLGPGSALTLRLTDESATVPPEAPPAA
jgi:hypothetical protein